ncbi:MAG: MBL fold metallo-hydrolase [Candidatus Acidiferrales bacterium]
MAKLTFLGAAGCVTGSKYLVEANGKRLLVDCGLFQGTKELRQRNWAVLPESAASIDWVVLTHAHLDHTGWLPRLLEQGFKGPIYSNAATRELCAILLPDSGHIQEEDAEYAQRKGYSSHKPALPLYTEQDARQTLTRFAENPRTGVFAISPEFSVRQHDAGHILGSASLELTITESGRKTVVLFSGDIGRYDQPILKDPEPPPPADILLCETTYGDRDHPSDPKFEELVGTVNRVVKRGGVMVLPAFAVGRTQQLMYVLRQLEDAGRIPRLPVYVDSPMAINVTSLYLAHHEDHDLEFNKEEAAGDPLNMRTVHLTPLAQDSKKINDVHNPCIIISASGMATGGRVLHHLLQRLPDPKNAVLLAGFQAEGTLGRALLEGAKSVRIFGENVLVGAEIIDLKQFSAHAGQSELLRWISGFATPPRQTFLVHGEPPAAAAFQKVLTARPGWRATVAQYLQTIDLSQI